MKYMSLNPLHPGWFPEMNLGDSGASGLGNSRVTPGVPAKARRRLQMHFMAHVGQTPDHRSHPCL